MSWLHAFVPNICNVENIWSWSFFPLKQFRNFRFNFLLHCSVIGLPYSWFLFLFLLFRERDIDKDGKISFNEFFYGLFDLVRTYDEENHNVSHHSDASVDAPAIMLFNQLDIDGDGYLILVISIIIVDFKILITSSINHLWYFSVYFSRHLSDVELLPIIGKIHPSERYYAKQQADYFISQVWTLTSG